MSAQKRYAMWILLCAGCCIFALSMGSRQSMGLFVSPLNSATHLGYVNISLAFAFG
ncbi:MAG: MFS transporter, partial [Burkholderiales bacterium]|nr:MFS transporter [Burkholderiales bacterium]